jgi:adenosylmethionine-8-amino-7-oxononanoate aminotransferase
MSHVLHRHCHNPLATVVGGDGVYMIDSTGKRYLDASGGAAVSCLGHSHAGVRAALHRQIDQVAYAHTSFFTSEPAEQLAERLVARAPGDLNHVYFVSGGSEAMESALKIARQYFVERGEPERKHFIARRQSYHGNTLGALAVGGNAWRRAQFAPLLIDVEHISPCYAYRDKRADESEFEYGQRVANELEQKILELGSDSVMAFVAEPVVGATAGAVPAVEGYYQRIRQICEKYGVLLILDEVMCGTGRTGSFYAHEQDGIKADIVAIAKGLGAGYQPIGAMLLNADIYDTIANGSGFFQHGHTYLAHTTAMAGSLAVMDALEHDGVLNRVAPTGAKLKQMLKQRFADSPCVGDVRGRGLFLGVELVSDRATKLPFGPASKLDSKIKRNAMELGLMCYPMGGTIDGKQGHHILLAPPYIIEDAQLDELVTKLGEAVETQCQVAARESV